MIKPAKSLIDAKKYVFSLKNKNVDVLINLGRNKTAKFKGTVTAMYPALFTVSPIGSFNGKTSFSYSELLCGGVKIRLDKSS